MESSERKIANWSNFRIKKCPSRQSTQPNALSDSGFIVGGSNPILTFSDSNILHTEF
jgi:hypothetical protein